VKKNIYINHYGQKKERKIIILRIRVYACIACFLIEILNNNAETGGCENFTTYVAQSSHRYNIVTIYIVCVEDTDDELDELLDYLNETRRSLSIIYLFICL